MPFVLCKGAEIGNCRDRRNVVENPSSALGEAAPRSACASRVAIRRTPDRGRRRTRARSARLCGVARPRGHGRRREPARHEPGPRDRAARGSGRAADPRSERLRSRVGDRRHHACVRARRPYRDAARRRAGAEGAAAAARHRAFRVSAGRGGRRGRPENDRRRLVRPVSDRSGVRDAQLAGAAGRAFRRAHRRDHGVGLALPDHGDRQGRACGAAASRHRSDTARVFDGAAVSDDRRAAQGSGRSGGRVGLHVPRGRYGQRDSGKRRAARNDPHAVVGVAAEAAARHPHDVRRAGGRLSRASRRDVFPVLPGDDQHAGRDGIVRSRHSRHVRRRAAAPRHCAEHDVGGLRLHARGAARHVRADRQCARRCGRARAASPDIRFQRRHHSGRRPVLGRVGAALFRRGVTYACCTHRAGAARFTSERTIAPRARRSRRCEPFHQP
ncbi:Metal-dependent amidase/aminoacylase/carboxypeptidase [Burkholderia dolosa AU0158]|nr:Metal-dependent amidase/aminoacylase/carboxypeptidase [Burkholderia dolosa AU0158]